MVFYKRNKAKFSTKKLLDDYVKKLSKTKTVIESSHKMKNGEWLLIWVEKFRRGGKGIRSMDSFKNGDVVVFGNKIGKVYGKEKDKGNVIVLFSDKTKRSVWADELKPIVNI